MVLDMEVLLKTWSFAFEADSVNFLYRSKQGFTSEIFFMGFSPMHPALRNAFGFGRTTEKSLKSYQSSRKWKSTNSLSLWVYSQGVCSSQRLKKRNSVLFLG